MKIEEIVERAKEAAGATSDRAFAKHLGVSHGTIANWRSGYSLPDTVACERLAGLTGIPLAKVLGIVGEARAISREEKAVWRKLAATAALLAVGVLGTLPAPSHAAYGHDSDRAGCIMRNSAGGLGCSGSGFAPGLVNVPRQGIAPTPPNKHPVVARYRPDPARSLLESHWRGRHSPVSLTRSETGPSNLLTERRRLIKRLAPDSHPRSPARGCAWHPSACRFVATIPPLSSSMRSSILNADCLGQELMTLSSSANACTARAWSVGYPQRSVARSETSRGYARTQPACAWGGTFGAARAGRRTHPRGPF